MIRAFLFLLKLGVVVLGAVWLARRPGDVTLVWQGVEIRTSVVVLLFAVVATAILLGFLYTLWKRLIGIPEALSLGSLSRRQRKGYVALTQGMVAVAAGDAPSAKRFAAKAEHLLNEPSLTLLLQAQAAQLGGDDAAASRYFGQMITRPDTSFLGLRGMMTQALKRGDTAGALTLARRASLLQPRAEWVLTSLVDLEARNGNWATALEALGMAERLGATGRDDARRLRATFLIAQSRDAKAAGEGENALRLARKAHDAFPGWSPAAAEYARRLMESGRPKVAAKVIERTWRADPHPDLARLYAEAGGPSLPPNAQVRRFERLASFNLESDLSRLAVAEAAIRAQLWGIARKNLAPLVEDKAGGRPASALRLMAELEEKESANPRAAQTWLTQASRLPEGAGWICEACAHRAEAWSPVCDSCNAVGTLAPPDHEDENRGVAKVPAIMKMT